jgi:hypothetical protein
MFTFFKRDCVMMMKQREFSTISAADRIATGLSRLVGPVLNDPEAARMG